MEEIQENPDKPKRGRPRKAVEETVLAIPEPPEPPVEPVEIKRTRKKPDPETAIQSDVSFTSKKGGVSLKAIRAPPQANNWKGLQHILHRKRHLDHMQSYTTDSLPTVIL